MSREDQSNVTIVMDGRNLGVWDRWTGADLDSDETKYRPGGMAPQRSLGGPKQRSNGTCTRLFSLTRDRPLVAFIDSRVGRGRCSVTRQFLDTEGNPFGAPITYTGTLKSFTLPDYNSESSDAALAAIEISLDAPMAA